MFRTYLITVIFTLEISACFSRFENLVKTLICLVSPSTFLGSMQSSSVISTVHFLVSPLSLIRYFFPLGFQLLIKFEVSN